MTWIVASLSWFYTGVILLSALAGMFLAFRHLKWGAIAAMWQVCYWLPIGFPDWYEGEYIDLYQAVWPAILLLLCHYMFKPKPTWAKVFMVLLASNLGLQVYDEFLYRWYGDDMDIHWYNTLMDIGNKLEFISLFIFGGRWSLETSDGFDGDRDHVRARPSARSGSSWS